MLTVFGMREREVVRDTDRGNVLEGESEMCACAHVEHN